VSEFVGLGIHFKRGSVHQRSHPVSIFYTPSFIDALSSPWPCPLPATNKMTTATTTQTTDQEEVQDLADEIARMALRHYDMELPQKAKPKATEWTVYAAIVAVVVDHHRPDDHHEQEQQETSRRMWVVSSGTGTKCCVVPPAYRRRHISSSSSSSSNNGQKNEENATSTDAVAAAATAEAGLCVLTDCHAEILARRGLQRVLCLEMQSLLCWEQQLRQRQVQPQAPQGGVVEPPPSPSPPPPPLYKNNNDSSLSAGECDRTKLLRIVEQQDDDAKDERNDNGLSMHDTTADHPSSAKYKLRDDLTLHLYVSDSPCGDASIYSIRPSPPLSTNADDSGGSNLGAPCCRQEEKEIQFTGAKVILSDHTTTATATAQLPIQTVAPGVCLAREPQAQLVGRLRTKSGRSNLEPRLRSQSMSCSDKITRWSILGLQGALLERHMLEPVRLTSLVVSHDPRADRASQLEALQRAVADRTQDALHLMRDHAKNGCLLDSTASVENFIKNAKIPSVHLVDTSFERGKARSVATVSLPPTSSSSLPPVTKKRKLDPVKPIPACGLCANWQCGRDATVEIVVGARGLRQGRKPKTECDFVNLASRLSRHALARHAAMLHRAAAGMRSADKSIDEYSEHKRHQATAAYSSVRDFVLSRGPLAGWLVGDGSSFVGNDDRNAGATTADERIATTSP
jgi:hypothetical protein